MNAAENFAVSPGWALLMKDMGIAPADVLRRAGLPEDLFSRGATSLTSQQYFDLWTALDETVDDPNLPLLVGRAFSVEAFDPPIFAAFCSRNLNEAARRLARYKKLIGPMRLTVSTTKDETSLTIVWPEHVAPPQVLVLTELVFWTAITRLATRTEIGPLRVATPEPPADNGPYRDYFGVGVSEGPEQTVVFAAVDAARPFLTANEGMWDFFEPELRRRLADMEQQSTLAERTRGVLLEMLPAGDASMGTAARRLGVSTRTLQRRLKEEGTSFKKALNGVREALARHYLTSSEMPAGEIAFMLGYEEASSFYRAFRGWTGMTPEGMRTA